MITVSYIPNGTLARATMSCNHPETGENNVDWLYIGESHRAPNRSASPAFPDFLALHDWATANKWELIPGARTWRYYGENNGKA